MKKLIVAIAIAFAVVGSANAQAQVSITAVNGRMGESFLTFSNGITCKDAGHGVVGPVSEFSSGWTAYWYKQGNDEWVACN